MRKTTKQILRKSLCGILCAAMLFSGISVPEFSAKAAEIEITEETAGTEDTENKEESTSREESEKAQESALAEEKETEEKKENASSEEMKESEDKAEEITSREDEKTEETKQSSAVEDEKTEETETRGVEESTKEETESSESTGTQVETIEESTEVGSDLQEEEEVEETDTEINNQAETTATFYLYVGDLAVENGDKIGVDIWGDNVSTSAEVATGWNFYENKYAYLMEEVEGYEKWYKISLIYINSGDASGFDVLTQAEKETLGTKSEIFKCSKEWQNKDVYERLASGKDTAIKGTNIYDSIEEAEGIKKVTLDQLKELVNQADEYKQADYTEESWKTFSTALTDANTVIADKNRTDEQIQNAYTGLEDAIKGLVLASIVEAEINVEKVALTDDFILGAEDRKSVV